MAEKVSKIGRMDFTDRLRNLPKSIAGRRLAAFLLVVAILINIAFVLATAGHLFDFGSFLASGQSARSGMDPYDAGSPLIFRTEYPAWGIGGSMVNLNPPLSVLVFTLLPDSHPLLFANLWRLASLGLYVLAVFLFGRAAPATPSRLQFIWALSMAGFWHTIQLGQIYVVPVCLLALSMLLEKKGRPILAGALAGGIVAIKPNLLIWILMLAAARRWKMSLAAVVSAAALSAIPALVYGPEIYLQWLRAGKLDGRILGMPGNSSLAGLTTRLGSLEIGLGLGLLLSLFYLIAIARRPAPESDRPAHALGLTLSLLASPISWTGYTLMLIPVFFWRREWPSLMTVAGGILAVPFIVPLFLFDNSMFNFVLWGWWYGWGLLLLLAEISRTSSLFARTPHSNRHNDSRQF
jgi:hypothetical protein